VELLLARVCKAAGLDRSRLVLLAEDSSAINAYATAAHLVCVTPGALRLKDPSWRRARPIGVVLLVQMPAPSNSATAPLCSGPTRSLAGRRRPRGASPALSSSTCRWRSGWLVSVRPSQGSVTPGLVSDQITHTAMAITRIDQNG
jgi:hypothetical protein